MSDALHRAVTLSSYLHNALVKRGKTSTDLANALKLTRSRAALGLLDGSVKLPLELVEVTAEFLHVDAADLLTRTIKEYLPDLSRLLDNHRPAWSKPLESIASGDLRATLERGIIASSLIGPDNREIVSAHSELGIPSLRLRHFFAKNSDGFTTSEAAVGLMLSIDEAAGLLVGLAELDYVKQWTLGEPNTASWRLAPDGTRLVDAHVPTPLSRASALVALDDFLQKISTINEDSTHVYRVTGVTAIGEFVTATAAELLPFVEVLVLVGPRHLDRALHRFEVEAQIERLRQEDIGKGEPIGPRFGVNVLRYPFERTISDFHENVCCRFKYED